MAEFDHEADGHLVLTVIGDGMRWACRTCDATVFQRDGQWVHFGEDEG